MAESCLRHACGCDRPKSNLCLRDGCVMTLGERAGSQNLREIYRVRKKFLDKVPVLSDFAFCDFFSDSVLFSVSFSICMPNFINIGDFLREIWHQKKRDALSFCYTRRESRRLLSQRRSVWREAMFTTRSTGTRSSGDSNTIQGAADPRPNAHL